MTRNIKGMKQDRRKVLNPEKSFLKKDELPYIISEVGVNHDGSMERARMMIEEISQAGGDAVKFQAYKAEKLASKNSPAYWDTSKEKTESQYELFKKYDNFDEDDFKELARHSQKFEVDFLATPFDEESVDFLESLMPFYKIASADITNKPLIEYIAGKDKPILLSTGASTIQETWQALEWIQDQGDNEVVLLHCILNYPTNYEDANLAMIRHMREIFPEHTLGYSDHTITVQMDDVLLTAWHYGARIIEKHYTFDKTLPGNDHYHAMDYSDLKSLVEKFKFNQQISGNYHKHYLESEEDSRRYARRSLVAARTIPKGKVIDESDLTWKRPGTGIPPWMIDNVIGGVALKEIKEDEVLNFTSLMLRDSSID